ncbi:MAG: protein kinase [Gemmatimonadota bacterium]
MSELIARLNTALDASYAIERQVGEGGMATVFLAQDLKHRRNVALKVLKPEFSAVVGAERFLGEIETTASLQHPHILPLFDSGEADGLLFYVMPFVEGETLRERLEREGQLPVDASVRIATAVASALDFAHRHGVVHRDIKPANILLQDGQPVVSDFGIALAVGAAGGSRLTETGLSVGTPFYMSPEQAAGDQTIGPPSDIYALAAVLYEMLVGEPPYLGKTAQAVLGKILQGEPVSATAVRKSIPANVDAAIRKALEKLPADRFATADGFAQALADRGFRHGIEATATAVPGPRTTAAKWAGWTVAAALAGALLWTSSRPEPVVEATRFAIPNADGSVFAQPATILPDGSGLIYVNSFDGSTMLWIRRWRETAGTPIAGTEGASPFGPAAASPDGRLVSFALGFPGALRVAPVLGGVARTLVDVAYGGGTWSPDGRTLYYITEGAGLASIDVDGAGQPQQLLPAQFPDSIAAALSVTDDGRTLLFRHGPANPPSGHQLKALDIESGEVTAIVASPGPAYVIDGRLLAYGTEDGSLMVAPFDRQTSSITGLPTIVETGLSVSTYYNPLFSLADDGSLFFLPAGSVGAATAVWVDRSGRPDPIDPAVVVWTALSGSGPELSPDGDKLALGINGQGWAGPRLSIKQLPDGPLTRVPSVGDTYEHRPSWSADGRTLYFIADAGGSPSLWTVPADGSSAPELFLEHELGVQEASVAPGGEWLVYRVGTFLGGQTDTDIYAMRLGTDEAPVTLVDSEHLDLQPAVSPNSRWLAYESNQSGQFEVYVRPFPETGAWREQISISGGREPVWSSDGTELFYRGSTHFVSVRVSGQDRIQVGARQELFAAQPFREGTGHPAYDVHPDGQRFVMLLEGPARNRPAVLVRNWSAAVARQLGN